MVDLGLGLKMANGVEQIPRSDATMLGCRGGRICPSICCGDRLDDQRIAACVFYFTRMLEFRLRIKSLGEKIEL